MKYNTGEGTKDQAKQRKEVFQWHIRQQFEEVAWADIKNGINRAVKELKASLDGAASNFNCPAITLPG